MHFFFGLVRQFFLYIALEEFLSLSLATVIINLVNSINLIQNSTTYYYYLSPAHCCIIFIRLLYMRKKRAIVAGGW